MPVLFWFYFSVVFEEGKREAKIENNEKFNVWNTIKSFCGRWIQFRCQFTPKLKNVTPGAGAKVKKS